MSHTPPVCEVEDESSTPTLTPCTNSISTQLVHQSTSTSTTVPDTLTPPETPSSATFPSTAPTAPLLPPHQQADWTALERASASIIPPTFTPDSSNPVQIHTWPAIRHAISIDRPDLFKRSPMTRPIYKSWCRATVAQYGSMTAYMLSERLHWTPAAYSAERGPIFDIADPERVPFKNEKDYNCMFNDWPYGSLEAGVVHLVVWSKIRILVDPESGLPNLEAWAGIQRFVNTTFVDRWRKWSREQQQENDTPGTHREESSSPDVADPTSRPSQQRCHLRHEHHGRRHNS